MKFVLSYILFAVIATIANISAQDFFVTLYAGPWQIVLSVFFGTLVGLVTKYLLDKKYIFQYQAENLSKDTQTFLLYTAMGGITTLIFWGFEFTFDFLFESKYYRYLGGVIGLAIGYWIKYYLDRKYVFLTT